MTKAADLVRQTRSAAGLTQRRLAALAGIPQSTVARIEAGTIDPRTQTLQRVLAAMNHDLGLEERRGVGVDRTLIRRLLKLRPADRIRYSAAAGTAIERLQRARRRLPS